ncbi:family 16 glycosylhydrolase [Wenyingzhuangia sp. IMCC45574]
MKTISNNFFYRPLFLVLTLCICVSAACDKKEETFIPPVSTPDEIENPKDEEQPGDEQSNENPNPSGPYFVEVDPTPSTKEWKKVENLSDEFNGEFDDSKWFKDPSEDPFGWYGREPALFESENVSVADGDLRVTVKKFTTPKTVRGTAWTHGGAILRSKVKAGPGQYYECRMQANKTVMSSTFWIAFLQNCSTGPQRKLELDIQECVGRVHDGTHSWAKKWNKSYHSNTWRHARSCDVDTAQNSPAKTDMDEENNSRYFVYGCWWKSPREILFYLDGKHVHSITNPPADFDIEGHITMAIETYDWNPIDANNIFETASEEDRTTKYDWVRTWVLEDK